MRSGTGVTPRPAPADPSPPPVARGLGWGLVAAGLAINELTMELTVVPDEEIGSSTVRLGVLGFQLACLVLGAWILVGRPRSRIPWHGLALGALSGLLAWFACFAVIDTRFPEALGSTGIRYFDVRARYAPDSVLVVVPRRAGDTVETVFRGDLATPGDPSPARPYRATFNGWGFRTNLGEPPFEMVVLGDSFVEFGERDSLTFSEELRRATGLSTVNLGRGWYGPVQYVELMRRYGPVLEPRYAVLCFFEGNDVRDTRAYLGWREGGTYYDFGVDRYSLPERFVIASSDVVSTVLGRIGRAFGLAGSPPGWDSGTVVVGDSIVPMKFAYRPGAESVDELLEQEEWRTLASILAEFERLSARNGAVPVVVFIPSKVSVYGARVVTAEGRLRAYLGPSDGQWEPPSRYADAVRSLTRELSVRFVDLGPAFRSRSDRLPLLYYSLDTHWTPAGRALAAGIVADTLAMMATGDSAAGP